MTFYFVIKLQKILFETKIKHFRIPSLNTQGQSCILWDPSDVHSDYLNFIPFWTNGVQSTNLVKIKTIFFSIYVNLILTKYRKSIFSFILLLKKTETRATKSHAVQDWLFRLGPHHILHPIYTRFCLLKRLCLQSNPGIFAPFFWKKKISIFDTKTRVGPTKARMNLLFFCWRVK